MQMYMQTDARINANVKGRHPYQHTCIQSSGLPGVVQEPAEEKANDVANVQAEAAKRKASQARSFRTSERPAYVYVEARHTQLLYCGMYLALVFCHANSRIGPLAAESVLVGLACGFGSLPAVLFRAFRFRAYAADIPKRRVQHFYAHKFSLCSSEISSRSHVNLEEIQMGSSICSGEAHAFTGSNYRRATRSELRLALYFNQGVRGTVECQNQGGSNVAAHPSFISAAVKSWSPFASSLMK